ncbi:hypothetical protein pEaSNUABM11_00151 [Erwinia phage pEa_SNUABM_11]|nr:hypothetical protein pEaSNUABM11_00151 [Erwinia phage pEa_SNUABM_11]
MHQKRSLVDMSPKDFVALFDEHVYGQEQAKKILAIALRNRYRTSQLKGQDRFSVHKQNVLFLGPTGTGKTSLIRVLRNYLELPVLEYDMTAFTESGYVGRSIEEIGKELRELMKTTKIPNWYLEAHGQPVVKEAKEKRYTRDELEKLQEKEFFENREKQAAHGKRYHAAREERINELIANGLYSPERHKELGMVYYLRCLMLGLYRENIIEDVSSLDSFVTLKTDKLNIPSVVKACARLMELSKIREDDDTSDMDEEMAELEMATLMSEIMKACLILETDYLLPGRLLMSSHPDMALSAHGAWSSFAENFTEGSEPYTPPAFEAFSADEGIETLGAICDNFEVIESLFTMCDEFTHYNNEALWVMPKWEDYSEEKIEQQEAGAKKSNVRIDPKSFIENFAVVFLDEFDKLIEEDTTRTHISRSGVQRSLLKMVEGGTYAGIDTTNVLFIAAGSFAGAPVSKLMPELQGRFPLRAHLQPLDADAYVHICKMAGSEFQGHIALMKTEDVKVNYDMDTYRVIAERTLSQNLIDNLGARRLGAVINSVFQPAMYEPEKYREHGFDIRGETLRNPKKESK